MLLFAEGTAIGTVFAILGILIALVIIAMFVFKSYVAGYNRRSMRKRVDSPLSAEELARANLDRAGLTDVNVKVKLLASGYSHRRKTLYISRKMNRRATVYSVGRVMQLVSLAIIYNTDDSARKSIAGATFMNYSATALFFIMIIVSFIVELASIGGAPEVVVLILTVLALIFYVFSIFVSAKKGSLIVRANKDAKEYIANMGIFDEKDMARINKSYDLTAKEFVVDKILAIIYVIYYALKLIGHLLSMFGKKK